MELTDKEKVRLVKEIISQDPLGSLGSAALIKLGRFAAEKEVDVKLQTKAFVKDCSYFLRLLVTATRDVEEQEAEQLYFIDCTFYVPKNNLEKMLTEEFRKHEHQMIPFAQVPELKRVYEAVVERYRQNRGTATAGYDIRHEDDKIWIEIGNNIRLTLVKTTGDFWTKINVRKENNDEQE